MILVTGSTGIVGSRLVFDLLKAGREVRAMKRASSDTDFILRVFTFYDPKEGPALFAKIRWVDADVLDVISLEEAMDGITALYHCAALVSYAAKDAERLIEANADGTANVVNCAIEAGVQRFCHVSSVAAVGKAKNGKAATEKTTWKRATNNSVYGLSKYLAEREVWRGAAEGLSAVIVNPSVIIGPAKADQSSGQLMGLLREGISYYPPGSVGLVDVRDVSRMCIALMEKQASTERYLLNAQSITFKELLTDTAAVYGNKPPTFAVKPWMLSLAWRLAAVGAVFTRRPPRITKETARSASQHALYENEKVKKALNTAFIPVEKSLAFFRNFYA